MKRLGHCLLVILFLAGLSSNISAQEEPKKNEKPIVKTEKSEMKHGHGFVDADGDGYNDNAPDHDGDGIPNGIDPDYEGKNKKKGFVDLDGDGINDNIGSGKGNGKRNRFKYKNSFENSEVSPQSGNVTGAGNQYQGENSNSGNNSKGQQKGKK